MPAERAAFTLNCFSAPAAPSATDCAVAAQPRVRVTVPVSLSFTLTLKALSTPCGSAPPPTLVSASASNCALLPSATVKVSPPTSAPSWAVAVSSSVAVLAPAPAKRTAGAAVPSRVAPVLAAPLFAARLQSPGVTPAPEIESGASMTSPFASARSRLTVNATLSPSLMALRPARARRTTVGSSSRRVTSRTRGLVARSSHRSCFSHAV